MTYTTYFMELNKLGLIKQKGLKKVECHRLIEGTVQISKFFFKKGIDQKEQLLIYIQKESSFGYA